MTNGKTNIIENIKIKTDKILTSNMNSENAGICKALLLGDKSDISSETYSLFSYSGISHLLAISGLHIGFIVALLYFVLKLFKIKNIYKLIIVSLFLLLYCLLCGFSSRIVRASIMSICLLFSLYIGKQNDSLSSLSFAGIIILLFNSFNIYSIGFQLSFCAVFGILFLTKPITNILTKIHIPYSLSIMIATTFSATVTTLSIIANAFSYIAIITLLSNIIVIPLFSVFFSLLFLCFITNLILPLGFLFVPLSYFITMFVQISTLLSKAGIIKISSFSFISTCIYFITIFLMSKFVMLKNKAKLSIFISLTILFSVLTYYLNSLQIFTTNQVFVYSNIKNTILITTKNNQKILLGNFDTGEYEMEVLYNSLKKQNIYNINILVLPNYSASDQTSVCSFCSDYKVEKLVICNELENSDVFGLQSNLKHNGIINLVSFENYYLANNLYITTIKYNSLVKAISIKNYNESRTDYLEYVLVNGSLTQNQTDYFCGELSTKLSAIILEKSTESLQTLASQKFSNSTKLIVKNSLETNQNLVSVLNSKNNNNFENIYNQFCYSFKI